LRRLVPDEIIDKEEIDSIDWNQRSSKLLIVYRLPIILQQKYIFVLALFQSVE
jgi:hypothetical protein